MSPCAAFALSADHCSQLSAYFHALFSLHMLFLRTEKMLYFSSHSTIWSTGEKKHSLSMGIAQVERTDFCPQCLEWPQLNTSG